MKMNGIWVRRAALTVAAVALLGSASPALAATAETWGARATTNSADTKVTITDTSQNANNAKAEFYVNGSNTKRTVSTSEGKNSSVSTGTYSDGIEKIKACNVRPLSPDNCSGWKNT